jgi:uncharacterized membrane protein
MGHIVCTIFAVAFLLFALLFAVLKEKGAMLISGFNTMSKAQREQYDKAKMVQDQRNALLLWALVFAVGAVLSYFVTQYAAIAAFIVWFILFFKDVHLDAKKAFEKYKQEL